MLRVQYDTTADEGPEVEFVCVRGRDDAVSGRSDSATRRRY